MIYNIVLYYIIYTVCLLHVSATLVVILRDTHYKGNIAKFVQPVHKCISYICALVEHCFVQFPL